MLNKIFTQTPLTDISSQVVNCMSILKFEILPKKENSHYIITILNTRKLLVKP